MCAIASLKTILFCNHVGGDKFRIYYGLDSVIIFTLVTVQKAQINHLIILARLKVEISWLLGGHSTHFGSVKVGKVYDIKSHFLPLLLLVVMHRTCKNCV